MPIHDQRNDFKYKVRSSKDFCYELIAVALGFALFAMAYIGVA